MSLINDWNFSTRTMPLWYFRGLRVTSSAIYKRNNSFAQDGFSLNASRLHRENYTVCEQDWIVLLQVSASQVASCWRSIRDPNQTSKVSNSVCKPCITFLNNDSVLQLQRRDTVDLLGAHAAWKSALTAFTLQLPNTIYDIRPKDHTVITVAWITVVVMCHSHSCSVVSWTSWCRQS
jgi:hypothetical protein